ncbi:MAG: IPT/TIG domain-containing protein [Candidatus Sulfotelmatobacter sp.]
MIDLFVLLTPIFLLGIVALLGFVGCDQIFGLQSTGLEPQISNVQPNSGPSVGGTRVQIFGSGFTDLNGATFGGVTGTNVQPVNDSEVDAVTPPHAPGPVDVVLTGNGSPLSSSFTFTYYAIGFVQANASEQNGNGPITVTLPNPTTKGNLLIVAVSYAGPSSSTVTLSDNLGDTFAQAGIGPWLRQSRLFYVPNIFGGNVTITATLGSGATGPSSICVSEYSGASAVYGFSTAHSQNTGTAGIETIAGVSVQPAQSGDLVYVVVFASKDTNLLAGANFTPRETPVTSLLVEDSTAAVTAPQAVATDDTTGGTFVPWVALAVGVRTA